jgi:hypothetical protein
VHASRLNRYGATRAPFEPSAQLLDTTRRAVPSVAHCRLIDNASAFTATEKPDAAVRPPSVQNARWAVALGAAEHEVSPAKMCFPPIAHNVLLQGIQGFAAGGLAKKVQHQMLCIRSTGYFKPNSSEQPTVGAKFQFPVAGKLVSVKPGALHVTKLAL